MKESVIRKIFSAINWPSKALAFQKLIDFIVEGLSSKAETSKVSELENKLSGLESKLSGLEGEISGLEGEISGLESSISTKADSTTVENLQSQLSSKANQSDLTALTSRVEALEGSQA